MKDISTPQQTVLVSCRGKHGETLRDNIITIAWHMPVSIKPQLYAIAVGKSKFSLELILSSKCFVVNFISPSMADKALYCGTVSGRDVDKFKKAALTKSDALKVECPRIREALGWIECKLVQQVEAGDHIVLIGEVVCSELSIEDKRLFYTMEGGFTTTVD